MRENTGILTQFQMTQQDGRGQDGYLSGSSDPPWLLLTTPCLPVELTSLPAWMEFRKCGFGHAGGLFPSFPQRMVQVSPG